MRARHVAHIVLAGVAWAATALAGAAYDADALVRVESRASVDSVTVGERFLVTHEFTYPDSLRMLPAGRLDLGKSRVVSLDWTETAAAGATTTRRASMSVITLDLDGARVPELEFAFVTPSGDTVRALTRELVVPVRLIAADSAGLNPLKDPWEAPRSLRPWLIAAAAALALAALAWLAWRRRRARVVEAPAAPQLPCDYVALTELTRIEGMGLLERGEFKTYYTLVVDAVRRYLEARFGVEAMDRTTVELLDDCARHGIPARTLGPLLHEADLVKFAKYAPTRPAGEAALRSARDVVVATAPRPAAAAAQQNG